MDWWDYKDKMSDTLSDSDTTNDLLLDEELLHIVELSENDNSIVDELSEDDNSSVESCTIEETELSENPTKETNENVTENESNTEKEIKIQSVKSAYKDYLKSIYRIESQLLLDHLREVSIEMGYPDFFQNRYTLFMFNELLKVSDTPNYWSNIRSMFKSITN